MLHVKVSKQLPHFSLEVDFQVEEEILVLFGPSGSGKTTILNMIAGLVKPDKGQIMLNHNLFFHSDNREYLSVQARNIGYVFQDYALFPHMTVKKNIWYGLKQRKLSAPSHYTSLLSTLKVEHLLNRYPLHLSGGEKQRVALVRALMTSPQLLLLDEPLSALDYETRIAFREEIRRLQAIWNIPFILVTHDHEEAVSLGDKILYIHEGKIDKIKRT